MLTISVIIPIYNVGILLSKTIESVLRQKTNNTEIILIDDGSVDDSVSICDHYAKLYPEIHLVHKKNEGVSSARNVGINIARGEYLMFIDAGDEIELNTLETLEKMIDIYQKPDIISYSFIYCYNDISVPWNGVDTIKTINNTTAIKLYFKNEFYSGSAWQSIYKKSVVRDLKFDKKLFMGEDQVFLIETFKISKKIILTPYYFYNYIIKNNYRDRSPCKENAVLNSIDAVMKIYKMFIGTPFEHLSEFRVVKSIARELLNAAKLNRKHQYNAIKNKSKREIMPLLNKLFILEYLIFIVIINIPYVFTNKIVNKKIFKI